MTDEQRYSESEAHYLFANRFRERTWNLLDQPTRTRDEDDRMLDYAHASLAHWRFTGTALRHQRGDWMLARVYAVLGNAEFSMRYARQCQDLLENNKDEMEDIDFAYAAEALARAHAIAGNRTETKKYIELAKKAGEAIAEQDDRDAFFKELNGGNWNEMK